MKNNVTFSTANYDYLYSCNHKECIPLHPILRRIIKLDEDGCLGSVPNDPELNGYSPEMIAYYLRKYDYLKAHGGLLPPKTTWNLLRLQLLLFRKSSLYDIS